MRISEISQRINGLDKRIILNIKIGAKFTTYFFETTIWTQIQSVEIESHIRQDKTDKFTTNKISKYEAGQTFFK
jgi:hypothetical protein